MSCSGYHRLGRRQQRVRELSRQGWRIWGWFAGLCLLIGGAVAGFEVWSVREATASDNLPEIILPAGNDFVYDLKQFQPGQTRFFVYPATSSDASRFLVQRDPDGVIRAAFASCPACYSYHRESWLSQGQLLCGHCQHPMRLGNQNERLTKGSCIALPVTFSVADNKVIVRYQAMVEGIKLFGNPEKGLIAGGSGSKASEIRP